MNDTTLSNYEKWAIWNRILNALRELKGLPLITTPNPYSASVKE